MGSYHSDALTPMTRNSQNAQVKEIAVTGDLGESASVIMESLLEVAPGGRCILYFDSPGGNAYSAISLLSVMLLRGLDTVGVVTGECSSAALWPFAGCRQRLVTPYSVLFFHPMRWQSEENVQLAEAAEWARHFAQLEKEMDTLLARLFDLPYERLLEWIKPGRYVSGRELAEAGVAQLIDLEFGSLRSILGQPGRLDDHRRLGRRPKMAGH
ncbi:MAG: hypothetical protein KatS3mg110_1217 [Pirellulaceae bacterium]|nr:MAG: hypothetical protein KatS3mg110_1217 [Pirellulaceae bacterium]